MNAKQQAIEALRAVRLRMIFVGWPAEPMWEPHGVKIPDWRKEFALIGGALASLESEAASLGFPLAPPGDPAHIEAPAEQPAPACECRKALESLVCEVAGMLGMAEAGLREAAGNTNVNCLTRRMQDGRSALSTPCRTEPCQSCAEKGHALGVKETELIIVREERDSLRSELATAKAYAEFEESRIVAICKLIGADDLESAANKVNRLLSELAAEREKP